MFRLIIPGLVAVACLLATAGRAMTGEPAAVVPVACVGDSITDGNSYVVPFQKLLGEGYQVVNCGRGGTTAQHQGDMPYWNTEQFTRVKECQPRIVTIMLGTNDTKPQNWRTAEECSKDLAEMVEIFQQLPSKPLVVLCLPPPAYQDAFGIRGAIIKDQLIPALRALAKAKAIPLLDIFTALSNHPECFFDGIHPNGDGAQLIAKTMTEGLAAIAKEKEKADKSPPKKAKKK
jgi:lysophospholipase L1-like esterase